ncbi:MAG TPA: cytochrome P450 [Acidimicrobiales bacterium]|jgi:cytochrome P450|nr:cytochrome P450 [Acidimicrobiales bacterium]
MRLEELPFVDVLGKEFQTDPYGAYSQALAEEEIGRCPFGAVVLGHQPIRELLRDGRLTTPGELAAAMFGITEGPFYSWWRGMLVSQSGPAHARLRRMVAAAFTAREADQSRPMMREILQEILDDTSDQGECDFATDIADLFTMRVLCRLIGVPVEDVPRFMRWVQDLGKGFSMNVDEDIADLDSAVVGLSNYVEELIASRQRSDDLLQSLVDITDGGDRLTHEELVSLVVLLLVAGYDTTSNQLSWGMLTFLEKPELWRRLVDDPSSAPLMVEELLRYRVSAAVSGRMANEDVVYEGINYPAGTYFMVSFAAAGRDPRAFPDPETFDADRDGETHVSFGFGAHRCLGMHIARTELEEAFTMLPRRLLNPRQSGIPEFGTPLGVHVVKSLPISFNSETL